MFIHSQQDDDPYKRAAFSIQNRIRRLLWQIAWITTCKYSPVFLHGWRVVVLRFFGAKIGTSNFIYPRIQIWAPWLLVTGDVVTVANGVEIYNPGGVELGERSIISQGAFLCGATHDYNDPQFPMTWQKIKVGTHAWICARAIVLPGVAVGDGAVLGAAAVTGKDLEPWKVYAGNPARLMGERKNHLARKSPGL